MVVKLIPSIALKPTPYTTYKELYGIAVSVGIHLSRALFLTWNKPTLSDSLQQ
jgi:hypothetical protein